MGLSSTTIGLSRSLIAKQTCFAPLRLDGTQVGSKRRWMFVLKISQLQDRRCGREDLQSCGGTASGSCS